MYMYTYECLCLHVKTEEYNLEILAEILCSLLTWNNWKTFKKNISNDRMNLSSMTCLNTSAFKRHLDNGKADDQQKIPSNVQDNNKKKL